MKTCRKCQRTLELSEFYPRPGGLGLLAQCRECVRQKNNAYYHRAQKHDPAHRARARSANRTWYLQNLEHQHARVARKHRAEREACFQKYGGVCACCGEHRYEFLAIDHINGGGIRHRKQLKITKIARWLARNGFPDGYRVLCHNCNMALGQYGYCPHGNAVAKGA